MQRLYSMGIRLDMILEKVLAVKTATTQTKSAYVDYKPAEAGFVCIAPILIAGQK